MSVLRAHALAKSFGGVTALSDVSLEVSEHELLGVVGPNGSGKTTLVDILSGLVAPDQGRIEVDGVEMSGRGAAALARRGVARTFQTARLMEPLSVRDNVMLGLHTSRQRGRRRRGAAVAATLDALGIGDLGDRAVRELSHGQRRRVELARAVVGTPGVLLLDEPTAGLFGPDALEVAELLVGIARSGVAIVVIEHDLGVIAATCTRVIVLDSGAVVDQGPTAAVLARPAVADLAGELGRDRLEDVPA